tara:strand:- start:319 stop:777 length:459 start_codon:yes stop_codon:yes gene_type:complete
MEIYNQYIMEEVTHIVCESVNVNKEDLRTSQRDRHIVDARRIVINILTREESFSLSSVGKFLNKHHATTIYHRHIHESLYEKDVTYKAIYDLCLLRHKTKSYPIFSDVLDLTKNYRDLEKTLEQKNKEIATLKYDVLKLQCKFREHNFMIPA